APGRPWGNCSAPGRRTVLPASWSGGRRCGPACRIQAPWSGTDPRARCGRRPRPSRTSRARAPLVVLAAEDHGVLGPDQALANGEAGVAAGVAGGKAGGVSVPDVERAAGAKMPARGSERRRQETAVFLAFHRVVGNGQRV